MGIRRYFFDTYALFALTQGSPSYVQFIESEVTITVFNLVELYFLVLRDFGEKKAGEAYEKFLDCCVDINQEVVREAMKLKLKEKKANLSYADCIGFESARKEGIPFLTGDQQFDKMPNVLLVR